MAIIFRLSGAGALLTELVLDCLVSLQLIDCLVRARLSIVYRSGIDWLSMLNGLSILELEGKLVRVIDVPSLPKQRINVFEFNF